MQAVQVLTWVPHEPRRALPLEVIQRILEDTDESSWQDVCFNLFLLILLFTFSRSECPCPKTFNGFDPEHHWQVRDLQWVCIEGLWCLAVRFKAIKQDPRVVRPEARGDGDWSYVGDVPGSVFSILRWLKAFMSFFADARGPDEPFFLNKDRTKPYTYGAAMADLRSRCARVGVDGSLYGLHGARVTGYNENLGPSGEDVVVAHGGWSDAANASRYRRFSLVRDIIPMASRMLEAFAKRMAQGVDPPHEASGDEAEPPASATAPLVGERPILSGEEERVVVRRSARAGRGGRGSRTGSRAGGAGPAVAATPSAVERQEIQAGGTPRKRAPRKSTPRKGTSARSSQASPVESPAQASQASSTVESLLSDLGDPPPLGLVRPHALSSSEPPAVLGNELSLPLPSEQPQGLLGVLGRLLSPPQTRSSAGES